MKINKISIFSVFVMLLIAFIAGISSVSAAGVQHGTSIVSVEINDINDVDAGETVQTSYKRGDDLDITIKLFAAADIDDVKVTVEMDGDEHHDIEADTDQFDVVANTYYFKSVSLNLPDDIEQDKYLLTVRVTARGYDAVEESYYIRIDAERHDVIIKDVDFSQNPIKAGRGLEAMIRVKNVGEQDEDAVKVGFEIPGIGVRAADVYIDDLEDEESRSSEPLYVRIPECTKEGTYDAIVSVEYDDGYKETTFKKTIQILEGDTCPLAGYGGRTTTIMIGADNQIVEKGKGAIAYPVTITNEGITSKAYQITSTGVDDWATVEVAPTNVVVVEAGQSEVVYVYVTAKSEAQAGEHIFTVNLKQGANAAESIALKATVTGKSSGSAWEKVKKGLEIGLVILLVLLIILGVIVAFNRMKGEKAEEEIEEPTPDMDIEQPVEDYSAGSYY